MVDDYVEALCQEMELRKDYLKEPLTTIYLGGGTPSQLSVRHLEQLFSAVRSTLPMPENGFGEMEITLECNPDDVTEEYARQLGHLPVNRVSMGAQTFSDERLRFLHRRHTAGEVALAVERLRKNGIRNISVDLMFGFPNETIAEWQTDIDYILQLGIEHISAYSLMYEEGTPLYRLLEKGEVKETDEELYRQMYDLLIDRLAVAGFEQYEISNFARLTQQGKPSAFRSRHNSSYWHNVPYMGVGASAHSYNIHSRQWNIASLQAYVSAINSGELPCETEEISADTHYNDMVTTALRTREGISLESLTAGQRDHLLHAAQLYISRSLLVREGDYVRLTRNGIYISDSIMSDLMKV
ncbi:radical SAM family heme chaperone HemW [Prevotella dentasini JCM 15908]